jgi:hypothetical protein
MNALQPSVDLMLKVSTVLDRYAVIQVQLRLRIVAVLHDPSDSERIAPSRPDALATVRMSLLHAAGLLGAAIAVPSSKTDGSG